MRYLWEVIKAALFLGCFFYGGTMAFTFAGLVRDGQMPYSWDLAGAVFVIMAAGAVGVLQIVWEGASHIKKASSKHKFESYGSFLNHEESSM